jgi:hypothetical protein
MMWLASLQKKRTSPSLKTPASNAGLKPVRTPLRHLPQNAILTCQRLLEIILVRNAG